MDTLLFYILAIFCVWRNEIAAGLPTQTINRHRIPHHDLFRIFEDDNIGFESTHHIQKNKVSAMQGRLNQIHEQIENNLIMTNTKLPPVEHLFASESINLCDINKILWFTGSSTQITTAESRFIIIIIIIILIVIILKKGEG